MLFVVGPCACLSDVSEAQSLPAAVAHSTVQLVLSVIKPAENKILQSNRLIKAWTGRHLLTGAFWLSHYTAVDSSAGKHCRGLTSKQVAFILLAFINNACKNTSSHKQGIKCMFTPPGLKNVHQAIHMMPSWEGLEGLGKLEAPCQNWSGIHPSIHPSTEKKTWHFRYPS